MLLFFVLFVIAGAIGGLFFKPKFAWAGYLIVAIFWASQYGPFWALVSLAEMGLGYWATKAFIGHDSN